MGASTEWNTFASDAQAAKTGSPLLYVLGFVFALFIAILIFCYIVTKRANPVLLDVNGHPVTQGVGGSNH
jgi:heme/copper-type cytochrome/quinol oxidase subunit 4